jgi:curved DNA-binding protein CbpA
MQDYYEILQVHPRADATAIEAAYARLRELYDPAKLDGAADELVDLARAKRDAIERAYAVLNDTIRRAAYDEEQAVLEPTKDERRKTIEQNRAFVLRPWSLVKSRRRWTIGRYQRPGEPSGRAALTHSQYERRRAPMGARSGARPSAHGQRRPR